MQIYPYKYNEYNGGGQDLHVEKRTSNIFKLSGGFRIIVPFGWAYRQLGFHEVKIIAGYDLVSVYKPVKAYFLYGSEIFQSKISAEKLSANIGYSFSLKDNNYYHLSLNYDLELRRCMYGHNLSVKLNWFF